MTSESALVRKIIASVKAQFPRAYCIKLADRFRRGLPDILIVCRAAINDPHVLFVEAKIATGRVTKIQAVEHEAIERAGGRVIVAKSVDDVLYALKIASAE